MHISMPILCVRYKCGHKSIIQAPKEGKKTLLKWLIMAPQEQTDWGLGGLFGHPDTEASVMWCLLVSALYDPISASVRGEDTHKHWHILDLWQHSDFMSHFNLLSVCLELHRFDIVCSLNQGTLNLLRLSLTFLQFNNHKTDWRTFIYPLNSTVEPPLFTVSE